MPSRRSVMTVQLLNEGKRLVPWNRDQVHSELYGLCRVFRLPPQRAAVDAWSRDAVAHAVAIQHAVGGSAVAEVQLDGSVNPIGSSAELVFPILFARNVFFVHFTTPFHNFTTFVHATRPLSRRATSPSIFVTTRPP